MQDGKLAEIMAALPKCSALPGIRAYIVNEGMGGNLDAAASVFHRFRQCDGYEKTKAELVTFLVARYAYRGRLKTAQELYALFAGLGTATAIFQARATALHILACMLMKVRLQEAVTLWRDYLQLPLAASCRKRASRTGLILLLQALKNSDTRLAAKVFVALHRIAQETGEQKIESKAQSILEKRQKAKNAA